MSPHITSKRHAIATGHITTPELSLNLLSNAGIESEENFFSEQVGFLALKAS